MGKMLEEIPYILLICIIFLVCLMGKYVTVSAKVPVELKERLRELNVNISQLVRKAIEEEVERREREALRTLAGEVSQLLRKVPPTEIVKVIREAREER